MKRKEIRQKYYEFVISRKKTPASLNQFLSYAGIKKKIFKKKYRCLNEVEADIWKKGLREALESLKVSTEFAGYTCRDKGLAMLYTWFDYMDLNRKFFKRSKFMSCPPMMSMCHLSPFKKESKKFIKNVIKQGFGTKEFKDRSIPPKYLADFFWSLFYMNLKGWKSKKSKKVNREEWMDAMVEKSMVFFFDSLAPNLFDSFFDMLKHSRPKK